MESLLTRHSGASDACKFCTLASVNRAVPPRDRWIAESENFVAFASVGALVDGWVLIVPRTHVLSLSAIAREWQSELDDLAERLSTLLQNEYGTSVARFEHGSSEPMQSVGCGVDHAHLHLVALGFDVIEETAMQHPHLKVLDHCGGIPAVASIAKGRSYIFMRNGEGREALILNAESESQLLRRVIAARVGAAERWNWREYPHSERADRCGCRLVTQGRLLGVGS